MYLCTCVCPHVSVHTFQGYQVSERRGAPDIFYTFHINSHTEADTQNEHRQAHTLTHTDIPSDRHPAQPHSSICRGRRVHIHSRDTLMQRHPQTPKAGRTKALGLGAVDNEGRTEKACKWLPAQGTQTVCPSLEHRVGCVGPEGASGRMEEE